MRTPVALLIVAGVLAPSVAGAADMAVKAPAAAAAPASPWDLAVTAAIMSDYNFRGITQSAHKPSGQAGLEPRYNFTSSLQGYAGVSAENIDFPNEATVEVDFYGGIRPTFGKLALDFGVWEYYYPGGRCFNTPAFCGAAGATRLPNGNVVKQNESFYEGYGKATYTLNDNINFGGSVWITPSVLNSGATGVYTAGTATLIAPAAWLPKGIGAYVSVDLGWWQFGTTDAFYGVAAFPGGIPYPSYANWDAGLAFTWREFTLDLRYYQSSLSKGDCNALTSDQTATGVATTPINPFPLPGSNWCGAAFIAKLSFDKSFIGLK
jgi:uncharacterized protein (TIGR02001 family)